MHNPNILHITPYNDQTRVLNTNLPRFVTVGKKTITKDNKTCLHDDRPPIEHKYYIDTSLFVELQVTTNTCVNMG